MMMKQRELCIDEQNLKCLETPAKMKIVRVAISVK